MALETGVRPETVPLLALLVYGAMALGGTLADRATTLSGRGIALVLVGAATALALGALSRTPPGFGLIAVAFCAFQALTVAIDARLQDATEGGFRSTVTSIASLLTEVLVVALFAAYAAGAMLADHATLFAACAAVYVAVAAAAPRLIDAHA